MVYYYKVITLDIDGDKVTDGDLFLKFKKSGKNMKLVEAKFVNKKEVKKLVEKVKKQYDEQRNVKGGSVRASRVTVESGTSFAHYVKAGFGLGLGSQAASAVFNGAASLISNVFSGDGDE